MPISPTVEPAPVTMALIPIALRPTKSLAPADKAGTRLFWTTNGKIDATPAPTMRPMPIFVMISGPPSKRAARKRAIPASAAWNVSVNRNEVTMRAPSPSSRLPDRRPWASAAK